jgi:hypothetical protein
LEGHFPGRRKSVLGGCGKNVLFFTPRKIPFQSRLLSIGLGESVGRIRQPEFGNALAQEVVKLVHVAFQPR